jgi:hypothetical protein
MDQPVSFPLTTQLGLLTIASRNPEKFWKKCQDQARKAVKDWEEDKIEVDVVELPDRWGNEVNTVD